MPAIIDWILKLCRLHQQQILCYSCTILMFTEFSQSSSEKALIIEITWIFQTWMHSFALLCKLHHGGHIGLHCKGVSCALATYFVELLYKVLSPAGQKSLTIYMHLSYLNAKFYTLCKLRHGSHIWSNWKFCQRATFSGVVWLIVLSIIAPSQTRIRKRNKE